MKAIAPVGHFKIEESFWFSESFQSFTYRGLPPYFKYLRRRLVSQTMNAYYDPGHIFLSCLGTGFLLSIISTVFMLTSLLKKFNNPVRVIGKNSVNAHGLHSFDITRLINCIYKNLQSSIMCINYKIIIYV